MPHYMDLLRYRTEQEEKTHRRWPSVHGEMAYKEYAGIEMKHLGVGKPVFLPGQNGEDCDPSQGPIMRHWCQVPKHVTLKQMKVLLPATFTRTAGCGHSYDCCGCSQYHVSNVRRVRRGQFRFDLETSYNY